MNAATAATLDREQRLDEILAVYLTALRRGDAPTRRQLCDSHPDFADELRDFFRDQDRFDQLATPLRAVVPALGLAALREFGDYTELEEIARGGMGVVFRARQKSLQRPVALKMLLAGPLASADDVQRFRTEAEAAASLHHPHIVPIYEVNTHAGYPYLSMQLLEGGSLAQVAGRAPWLVESKAAARRVVEMLLDLAAAVEHAHRHGILHRDLKPANILLDGEGKAHVSDFGLAKRAQPLARLQTTMAEGEVPIVNGPTRTGTILGTPAYMAPEQASREREAVTVAADVYGLGAILYELLTGRPPFRGATPLETLQQVLEREPVAPSKINKWVDRDLETICLKCLHKQPPRRYGGAAELAADLERYLRGEPIQARPVGALERAWRWCLRQPVVAALTLALVLTVLAAVSSLTVLWFRAERHAVRAESGFHAAEDARTDADASFRLAHAAVVDFSSRFVQELDQSSGLQPVQKAMLEAALGYFQQFVEKRGNDPALRRELAQTYGHIANLTAAIGSTKKAEAALQQALAIYRDLLERDPDDQETRRRLAGSLINLSVLQTGSQKWATTKEAIRLHEEFLRQTPDDRELRRGLATALQNFSVHYETSGQVREALSYSGRAAALLLELQQDPQDIASRTMLATVFHTMSNQLNRQPGNTDTALCSLHHAQVLREDLVRLFPREPRRRADLAGTQYGEVLMLRDQGHLPEAQALMQDVLAARQKLVAENPSVTRYQIEVGESQRLLGELCFRRNDWEAARSAFEQSRDAYLALAKRDPENRLFPHKLSVSWFDISTTYGAQKKRRDELQALEKARELMAPLVERDGDNLDYRAHLGTVCANLGLVLGRLNRYDESVAALKQGIEHSRVAVKGAPAVESHRIILNANLGTLGEIERHFGHADRAVAATLERRDLWVHNPGELIRVARDLALAAGLTKNEAERARYGERTVETLRQAQAAGFHDAALLRQDKEFDAVRERADFKQWLNDLAEKSSRR